MKIQLTFAALFAALLVSVPVHAQDPVTAAPDVDALFHSKDKKLDRNKQAAYHIEKDLLEANHWNEADKWLTERYIQHNPNARSGRAGVVAFFSSRKPTPVPEHLGIKVVFVSAEGDYVTVGTVADRKDANGQPYTTTWFDTWRFVNGKADEHWDCALKGR
ncbi:MAG TPA: nuclear transport factor 2 family protein [Bryobacteraceae bacterium]|nr:nuclear transport factor 2 family protein [Bryobacteraceae bacterium]HUO32124.1 nuclear transport factor 2 family protein [Bryobacteraceae bacterium]